MNRRHRSDFEYAFHHVFNRASARKMIFERDVHHRAFLETLEHVVKSDDIQVHAFCLMGNHYHLLLRTPRANLSQAMHRLGGMFTRKFNRIERIDGPLFRGRYRSKIVGQDDYLRQLFRYIHRNPVEAGIVQSPEEYYWSSYRAYIYFVDCPGWLSRQELPTYFSGPNRIASMRDYVEKPEITELDRLRLEEFLRSSSDSSIDPSRCIMPSGEVQTGRRLEPAQLSELIKVVSKHYGIDESNILCIQRGTKNHPRNVALYLARTEACLKVHEVAKEFSISRTAVSSALSRLERQLQIDPSLKTEIAELSLVIRRYRTPAQMTW